MLTKKQMMLLRGIIMNRLEFDELEWQVQSGVLLLKSYLQQSKHTIFRLDAHYSQTYLCAITK